jgi:hypothetical protein
MPNQASKRCSKQLYADDAVIFISSKALEDIENVLKAEMKVVDNWLKENKLFT